SISSFNLASRLESALSTALLTSLSTSLRVNVALSCSSSCVFSVVSTFSSPSDSEKNCKFNGNPFSACDFKDSATSAVVIVVFLAISFIFSSIFILLHPTQSIPQLNIYILKKPQTVACAPIQCLE